MIPKPRKIKPPTKQANLTQEKVMYTENLYCLQLPAVAIIIY